MIIVMNKDVTEEQIGAVVQKIQDLGHEVNISRGTNRTVIGAIGDESKLDPESFDSMPGVEYSMHIVKQYKIVSRESHKQDSIIDVRGIPVGGKQIQVIGGPCSVETPEQMDLAAQQVAAAGCRGRWDCKSMGSMAIGTNFQRMFTPMGSIGCVLMRNLEPFFPAACSQLPVVDYSKL